MIRGRDGESRRKKQSGRKSGFQPIVQKDRDNKRTSPMRKDQKPARRDTLAGKRYYWTSLTK